MVKRVFFFLSVLWVAGVGLAACADQVRDPALEATAQALQTAVPLTATQRATLMPNPYSQLLTAQAQATAVAAHAQATMQAVATLKAAQADATSQAFAPVLAALPFFGVQPATEGRPGWLHPPISLTAKGYHTYTYGTDYPQTVLRDGVLSADITWDTRYGSGGCGFVLRANGDEQKPSQYVVLMTRGGWLFFIIFKDGEIANLRPVALRDKDRKFNWHNGATNQLTVVLRDRQIAVYTNRTLHKVFDPNEMPSLYIPVVTPPRAIQSDNPPPALPPPPPPPSSREGWRTYLSAVKAYRTKVSAILDAYIARLDRQIGQEQDPTRRTALQTYRATLLQQQQLVRQSTDAIQFFVGHPKTDLAFGPGFLSFVAVAESAYATCDFRNGWLWVLDP